MQAAGSAAGQGCEDRETRCAEWAQLGKCSANSEFMGRVCCVSCGGVERQKTMEAKAGGEEGHEEKAPMPTVGVQAAVAQAAAAQAEAAKAEAAQAAAAQAAVAQAEAVASRREGVAATPKGPEAAYEETRNASSDPPEVSLDPDDPWASLRVSSWMLQAARWLHLAPTAAEATGVQQQQAVGGAHTAVCADKDDRCAEWAQLGKCSANSEFMGRVCCLSCWVCADKDDRCADWAQLGECSANSEFMGRVCCV